MHRHAIFLLAGIVLLSAGCASNGRRGTPAADTRISNATAYDSYVTRRTDELTSAGKYSKEEARTLAESEATRRYGTRTTGEGSSQSASWTWGSQQPKEVSKSDLDSALKRAGQK
ncbi:hypothetical protein [Opitutus sp. ER46]|uniref:hypothetical protein n=1 Tax=Opitutus sp. ER46 TaxID=2161864 RepID=UPI000D307FAF|nr:hypothetical protein [Opitutus sp. ER46]PTX97762.1 hypothetical protein DB354_05645 [Opitutus sp. ER46]